MGEDKRWYAIFGMVVGGSAIVIVVFIIAMINVFTKDINAKPHIKEYADIVYVNDSGKVIQTWRDAYGVIEWEPTLEFVSEGHKIVVCGKYVIKYQDTLKF